ncbi:MAG: hypothetical protein LBC39_08580 [Methanobrevibacter sp.]|jgi:hypothetical protein|nr:hypothetical protein [Candidatus Methanovirga aequatorialis]
MESDTHTLTIEPSKTTIKIVARNDEKVAKHEIQVKLVLSYYWSQNLPVVEKFLELLEVVIKNSIFRVFDHDKLRIKYRLRTNDNLESASSIFIEFLEVKADETLFEIIDSVIALEGIDKRGKLSKVTSFRRKINRRIEKEI